MGMGDLKLCAAEGGWIGPGQLGIALVATSIAGGVLALIWAGLPQIARRIARRRGRSRLGVLDQGCTSASKLGSR
jgi:Flp pilus assembly protein protease CpaA